MNFRLLDIKKLKINYKIGGLFLMLSFLVVGTLVLVLQINKDIAKIKNDIYINNKIVSYDILTQLAIFEHLVASKADMIEIDLIREINDTKNQAMVIETGTDTWTGRFIDIYGNNIYTFVSEAYNPTNDNLKEEMNSVAYFVRHMSTLNQITNDSCFIYTSQLNDFDIAYPIGITQKEYDHDFTELHSLLDDFGSISNKSNRGSSIVNNTLYLWKTIQTSNKDKPSYSGIAIKDLENLISYPESTLSDALYIYTNGTNAKLRDDNKALMTSIESFYAIDYKLHEYVKDGQVFHYRRLTDEILYVSRTSLINIQSRAYKNNIAFFVIFILAVVMILIIYFYLMKYRRNVELEMESSEQEFKKTLYKSRLGHIMNTISEAFVRADSTYTILEINQAAADMLGYRISEMLGQVITDFMAKPLDVKVRKNDGLYNCYEVSLIRKNGERLYGLVNKSTVITDNPITKEHYVMISDITPLIEAQQKAEEANRSKSRFIANLSHEIRTPMNATIGYIYLLEQTYLTEIQKKYLKKMDYASNTLLEIIDEILDFSKIEADHLTLEEIPFNLHKVIVNAVGIFENMAFRKEIQLELHIDENIPEYVLGDPYRYRQVIINILSNAFKFTSVGSVSVTVDLIDSTESQIKETVEVESVIRLIVEDTGIGIADERMEILFEPFVQADDSTTRIYGGTGLGLAICKRLINLMGGIIYAKSEEQNGSQFIVEVPFEIADRIHKDNEPTCQNHRENHHSNKKVLIVEDNPLNQELLVDLLRQKGNKVVVADNGKVAIEILTKPHKKRFDLILMDIQMPIQDGFTTTKVIRTETDYKKVPVIAITANADKETQIRLAESGVNDYLLKPINATDLYSKIGLWN